MNKSGNSHRFLIILVILSILIPLTFGNAMAQVLPHVVLGVVTYNGSPISEAMVEVSTSIGSWSFTTDYEGRYGGGISLSGPDDIISVNATYDSHTVSVTADPTASATMINIDITDSPLDSGSTILLLGIIVAVIIVIALVIIILMRRKK